MGTAIGRCPKCGKPYLHGAHPTHKYARSTHHIVPKRHGGKYGHTIELCRHCHDLLEKLIPFEEQPRWFYYFILNEFMEGDYDAA